MNFMKRPYIKKLQKSIDTRLIYITSLQEELMQQEEILKADLKELRVDKNENEIKLQRSVDERLIYITIVRQQLIQEEQAVQADIKALRVYKIENEIKYLNSFITA